MILVWLRTWSLNQSSIGGSFNGCCQADLFGSKSHTQCDLFMEEWHSACRAHWVVGWEPCWLWVAKHIDTMVYYKNQILFLKVMCELVDWEKICLIDKTIKKSQNGFWLLKKRVHLELLIHDCIDKIIWYLYVTLELFCSYTKIYLLTLELRYLCSFI